jgi:ubiquinol-cytochrome c reductase cytochrome c subunit
VKALAARRRHPLATVVLLLMALVVTGAAYAVAAPKPADASTTATGDVGKGRELFLANCATCHGAQAAGTNAGPSLVGVGAAAVDFQVGTGRMPMQNTAPQAPRKPVELSDQDTKDIAAYVASLGPGPAIPDSQYLQVKTDDKSIANGAELFRVNCAMCHNVVGAGGALTRGKYAPPLDGVTPEHIYEAMATGPQSMPVFNDANLRPTDKQDVISYLKYLETQPSPGGLSLGSIGPVSEALFVWVFGMAVLIGCAVWLGAKSS